MEFGKGLAAQPLACVMCGDACKNPADSNGLTACDNCVQFAIESVCGIEMTQAPKKRGRPATARGPYNPNPPRQLGRVSDADWQLIRDACEASGQSLVKWALPLLLREARRKVKRAE